LKFPVEDKSVIVSFCLASTLRVPSRRGTGLLLVFSGLTVLLCGCAALNPAFVNLFDPSGSSSFATLPNAPGHVVIAMSNQTEVDERLLDYLLPKMNLSDPEEQALRPRIRMRVRITYVDGTFQTVEFIDGSSNLVDPAFDAQSVPDLNQNDLNNAVVLCDVARVELEPGTNVEVYLPTEIIQYQLVESTGIGGDTVVTFEQRGILAPVFWPIQVNVVDEDGNVTLQRNVGVRDVPSPTPNVICGSVVVFTVQGSLAVPFLDVVSPDTPSVDQDDLETVSRIGGRYQFIVTVQ
jgi:hypothetical protein